MIRRLVARGLLSVVLAAALFSLFRLPAGAATVYQKITGMIRSLMEAQLDKNEQIEGLGRKLDQTMLYMKLDEGTYLIYEYPADSYAPVYFFISDYPDDLLVCLASADPRYEAGPHAFIGVREVRDYLNSL